MAGFPKMDGENNEKPYEQMGWFGGKTHHLRKHPYNVTWLVIPPTEKTWAFPWCGEITTTHWAPKSTFDPDPSWPSPRQAGGWWDFSVVDVNWQQGLFSRYLYINGVTLGP